MEKNNICEKIKWNFEEKNYMDFTGPYIHDINPLFILSPSVL